MSLISAVVALLLLQCASGYVNPAPQHLALASAYAISPPPTSATPPPPTQALTLPPPATPCVLSIVAGGPVDLNDVCTWYDLRMTSTSYIDCGGCELRTAYLGHGPQKTCAVTIKLPILTTTETACSPTPAIATPGVPSTMIPPPAASTPIPGAN